MRTFYEETPPAAPPPPLPVANSEPVAGSSKYDPIGNQTPAPGPLNLTDAEQDLLRQAASDPNGDLRAIWSKIHADRAAAQASEPAAPDQPPDPSKPADVAPEVNEALLTDDLLRERSGGAASLALIEPIMDLGNAFSARLDHAWQQGGEKAFGQAIEAGLSEIREREFAGSAERMNEAFGMIDKAAQILDPSGGLLKALNESGCLADHQIFRRAHLMAASVLNKAGQK